MSSLANFTEEMLEEATLEILQELGYEYAFGPEMSHDGERPEKQAELMCGNTAIDVNLKNVADPNGDYVY